MAPTHGKASTYVKYGCRCEECKAANTARGWRTREELARRPRGEVPHGLGGYKNWACRCDVCTEANSKACAEYKARRRKKTAAAAVAPAPAADETTQP